TQLLLDAEAAGCKTVGGLGMLLWQGAEAYKLFTGKDMPVSEVKDLYFN
ncbi:shikimate dehydrogenase, partial [Escherichia coli]|nr:shikimate dehydrogenase [Escherichia coli]